MAAIDKLRDNYLDQHQLAEVFGVTHERIQDMKSKGQLKIPWVKLSSKRYYYHIDDVMKFMEKKRRGIHG